MSVTKIERQERSCCQPLPIDFSNALERWKAKGYRLTRLKHGSYGVIHCNSLKTFSFCCCQPHVVVKDAVYSELDTRFSQIYRTPGPDTSPSAGIDKCRIQEKHQYQKVTHKNISHLPPNHHSMHLQLV